MNDDRIGQTDWALRHRLETLRRHDTEVRLAGRIGLERFGWRAAAVARLLVVEEGRTPRRHVEQHRGLFARAHPNREPGGSGVAPVAPARAGWSVRRAPLLVIQQPGEW